MLGIVNDSIMEFTLGIEKVIILTSSFHVLDVDNRDYGVILLKEDTYDMIGLIDGITQKYTLGVPLGAYDTLGIYLVEGADDGILISDPWLVS